ncbi:hypothetical protein V2J09_016034 [Rumex salicifolius]
MAGGFKGKALNRDHGGGLANPVEEEKGKGRSFGRKAVSTVLLCLTGGVALSAIDDLAVYHGCSSKAMEKVSVNQALINAIGEPVEKGPWYNASLAVANKRNSVSCSFPVSGPQGNGILHLKAVRNGEWSLLSFFQPREFEILMMDALLHVPSNDEKHQTIKINLSDDVLPSPACVTCPRPQEPNIVFWADECKWPQGASDLLELRPNSVNFIDDIFKA